MERKYWHLNGECQEERPEYPSLVNRINIKVIKFGQVKSTGWVLHAQVDKSHQHEQRTCKCVDEEFNGNFYPVLAAPHGADKVNWYQGYLPSHVKQKPIESGKYNQ